MQSMDKTTLVDCLKKAVLAVSQHPPEFMIVLDNHLCRQNEEPVPYVADNYQIRSSLPKYKPKDIHRGDLHSHACVEICFAVKGLCRIWTENDSFISMSPNDITIVQPGITHCEGWEKKKDPYLLLWMVLLENGCTAFMSSYIPGMPQDMGNRVSIMNSDSKVVIRALKELHQVSGNQHSLSECLLQGGMLVLLSDLLRRAEYEQAKPYKDRTRYLIAQVRQYIDLHYTETISIGLLAGLFRLSPNYLNKIFTQHSGIGIHAYLLNRRIQIADTLLRENKIMVKEAAYSVGFSDPLYFSRLYKKRFGYSPSRLNKD